MKISKEAIEAGARAMDAVVFDDIKGISYTGRMLMSEKCIEAALPNLQDCKASPQTVQSFPATATQVAVDDEEVERVGKAIYDEWQTHCTVGVPAGPYTPDPRHDASRNARWAARAAIRAIREGGQRWGVWCVDPGRVRGGSWEPLGHSRSLSCTDKALVLAEREAYEEKFEAYRFEVRPYPGEREKTEPAEVPNALDSAIAAIVHCVPNPNPEELSRLFDALKDFAAAIRDAKENTNGK